MVTEIGTALKHVGKPYWVRRDTTGTWRIVNLLDQSLEKMTEDDDLPDNHPAVTIISEGAFLELIKEASSLGIIQKLDLSDNEQNEKLKLENEELRLENKRLKLDFETVGKEPATESYKIKSKVIDSLMKIVVVGSLENES